MKLPHKNSTVSIKRRTVSEGNKKSDVTLEEGISAFVSDTGTTADHEQTYLIMFETASVSTTINPDTDTISDGTNNYKIANASKKTYHYEIRAIKTI